MAAEPLDLRRGSDPGAFSRPADLTGSTVGRFVIRARLGSGGMGEVYKADDPQLKRTVAIKRLALDHDASARRSSELLKEAQRASALSHPGIAAIHDVFEDRSELFLVMEYIDGVTLRQRLSSPLGVSGFIAIASQCADALGAAHANGIVHGDLKPANIMLTRNGQVKICDFGLARRVPRAGSSEDSVSTTTARQGVAGTPAYMAPEVVLERPVDVRADLFSLGVVFYEMLARRNPFAAAGTMATFDRVLNHTPESVTSRNPLVTPRLARLVHRLLEKDPEGRPGTAVDVARELAAAEAELPAVLTRRRIRLAAAFVATIATLALLPFVAPTLREWQARETSSTPLPTQVHVAVLPFAESGSEPVKPSFANGFAEALTVRLGRLTLNRPLQVASVLDIRSGKVSTPEDARHQLGANLALRGTVTYERDDASVTAELVDTETGQSLRAETARVTKANAIAVQDQTLELTVRLLDLDLTPAERGALFRRDTTQPGAYDFYLQARGYLLNFDRLDSLDSAVAVFRRALEIDRRYALAYAGLGQAYWQKHELTGSAAWVEPARAACEGALGLDADLAEAHACLGMVLTGTGEYDKAAGEYALAVAREPTNDAFQSGLARAYERLGRSNEAEQAYRRAIELRPHYWAGYSALGAYYYHVGRYDDAIAMFQQVVGLAPDSFRGYSSLGASYFMKDRTADAVAAFEKSLAIRPNDLAASNLGTLLYYEGNYQRAADLFRKATSLLPDSYEAWGNLAHALERAGAAGPATAAYREARRLVDERLAVNPRNATLSVARAEYLAALGDEAAARRSLHEALELKPTEPHTLLEIAKFYEERLRERQNALVWLRQAIAQGQTWREIDRSPALADLRRDSRFQELRRSR